MITGEGSYVWADGSAYRGDVESGLRHGKGTFFCATNPSVYSGDWVRGKRTGTVRIFLVVNLVTFSPAPSFLTKSNKQRTG